MTGTIFSVMISCVVAAVVSLLVFVFILVGEDVGDTSYSYWPEKYCGCCCCCCCCCCSSFNGVLIFVEMEASSFCFRNRERIGDMKDL